ncbi:MAG: zinc-dependent metalloprotease, partial [Acidobacteriota bacterium]
AALDAIVHEGIDQGFLFLTDEDARPPGASDPRGNLWDNGLLDEGVDAVDALESTIAVRRHALDRFGEHNLSEGTPLTHLHEVLVPVYLHHRYQLEAAAKTLGGMEYHFVMRGDGQTPTRIIDGVRQRRALDVMLGLLDPAELDLSDRVLDLLVPRPFAVPTNREMFVGDNGPAFDPLDAAAVAVRMVLDGVLQPERLARVADFHRRDGELPSVDEVLHRLFMASFGAGADDSPRHAALRHVVRGEVVDRLLLLAGNHELPGRVRAPLLDGLNGLSEHLGDGAHGRMLGQAITRFLARPHRAAAPTPPPAPAPPGSPIGQPTLGGCSGPHFLTGQH